jgi:hypothetical protein
MDGSRSSKERQNFTRQSVTRECVSAEKWAEHAKPIITPYALKDIFNLDETAHFIMYNGRRIWHVGRERM